MRAESSPVDFTSVQSDQHKPEVYPISSSPSDAAQPAIVPAIAFESAGGNPGAFVLGMDLGSHGIDIGGADCGNDKDHL